VSDFPDLDAKDYFGLGIVAVAFIALIPLLPIFAAVYWLGRGFAVLLKRWGWRP
jgi:hypothetical protein